MLSVGGLLIADVQARNTQIFNDEGVRNAEIDLQPLNALVLTAEGALIVDRPLSAVGALIAEKALNVEELLNADVAHQLLSAEKALLVDTDRQPQNV